ncbi:MAG TPA: PKD domain-containing protein [Flavobacteriales bacterium]|nr:PKD domain-containing protein [Flavobacteriales bacterium]
MERMNNFNTSIRANQHGGMPPPIRRFLLLALMGLGLLALPASAQQVGDYRSAQSGSWDTHGTWEQWNGTQWVTQNANYAPGEVTAPVNVFPQVAATSTSGKTTTSNQAHVISLPTGIEAGDLLLIFWVDADNNGTEPTLSGWTQLASSNANTSSIYRKIWYRIADGTEGSTVSTNAFGDRSAHVVYRIAKDTYTGIPFVSGASNGTGNSPDPNNLNPGQGTQKFLWIASAHGARSGSVSTPTGFSNDLDSKSSNSSNNDSNCQVTTATREDETNQMNPGSFSRQRSAIHTAWTVAIQGTTMLQHFPHPVVTATAQGAQSGSDVSNHNISIPAGEVGDMLVTVFSSDGNVTCSTTSSGWNKLGDHSHPGGGGNNQPVTGAIFWKMASGTTPAADALTVNTSANERSSHITYRIKGATGISGTASNGSGTNSNPPNHNATEDSWLWIATRSGDGTVTASAAPANYTDLITEGAGNANGASTNAAVRVFGTPQASEDPGTFTSGSEQWVCWTLAIEGPAPVVTSYTPIDMPAMGGGDGFPLVAATATSAKTGTPGTTHTVALPSGIEAGDLLMIFWADANTVTTIPGTPSGWTNLYSGQWPSSNIRYMAMYRVADGTEGNSINITAGAERSAHLAYRIAAGTYQGTPVASNMVTGNNTNPDPNNLTSGFGNVPTLWLAAAHVTGTIWATAPTNYGGLVTSSTGNVGVDHAYMATATRKRSAASENPGSFTLDASHSWGAWAVAIQGVPTTITNALVRSGHTVTVGDNNTIDNLTIEAGGAVGIDGGTLTVNGNNLVVNGTIGSASDALVLGSIRNAALAVTGTGSIDVYDLTVNTSGGATMNPATDIRGTLQLNDGLFTAVGNVTLVSNATGTGRLGPVGPDADYDGNLTVERYIPAGRTNWRLLGSPVADRKVQHWKDDFFTAGFPGSHYPNFYSPVGSNILWPSIRWYDETVVSTNPDDGMVGVTDNMQPLSTGQGFSAWCGDNLTTTTAFKVDVTGAPHIAKTPITFPMSFTSSGDVSADGWNLVSNPLPSPIDFTQVSRGADVQNAYWIFDPVAGNNKAWSNGVGTGGVNGIIQSSQGFWMKANGTGLTTTVSESAKVNQPVGGLFGGSQQPNLPILNLAINSNLNAYSDEATIVFANGTPEYDATDALKFAFHTIGAPQIGVLTADGHELSIDFFGTYSEAVQIPLRVAVEVNGTYTIQASLSGFNMLSCLSLLDQKTGVSTPLTDGASYSFTMNTTDSDTETRFVINGSRPMPLVVDNALCHGLEGAGSVVSYGGTVTITWADAFGNALLTQHGQGADTTIFQFDAPAGNYMVRVTPGGECGELAASFSIAGPAMLESEAAITGASCPNSADGQVEITTLGGTAPYQYAWSNGGDMAAMELPAGDYTVTITDDAGCTGTLEVNVPAGEGPTAQFEVPANITAGMPAALQNNTVGADDYSWDLGDGTTSGEEQPGHTWATAGTYTVTLTATGGDCSDTFTMEVAVGVNMAVGELQAAADIRAWATPDHIVIEHPFGNSAVDVDVHDATGRRVMAHSGLKQPGRILLGNAGLGDGVWFVRITSGEVQHTVRVPLVR